MISDDMRNRIAMGAMDRSGYSTGTLTPGGNKLFQAAQAAQGAPPMAAGSSFWNGQPSPFNMFGGGNLRPPSGQRPQPSMFLPQNYGAQSNLSASPFFGKMPNLWGF